LVKSSTSEFGHWSRTWQGNWPDRDSDSSSLPADPKSTARFPSYNGELVIHNSVARSFVNTESSW